MHIATAIDYACYMPTLRPQYIDTISKAETDRLDAVSRTTALPSTEITVSLVCSDAGQTARGSCCRSYGQVWCLVLGQPRSSPRVGQSARPPSMRMRPEASRQEVDGLGWANSARQRSKKWKTPMPASGYHAGDPELAAPGQTASLEEDVHGSQALNLCQTSASPCVGE